MQHHEKEQPIKKKTEKHSLPKHNSRAQTGHVISIDKANERHATTAGTNKKASGATTAQSIMNARLKCAQHNWVNQNSQAETETKKRQEATNLERKQQASTHFELDNHALQVRPASDNLIIYLQHAILLLPDTIASSQKQCRAAPWKIQMQQSIRVHTAISIVPILQES